MKLKLGKKAMDIPIHWIIIFVVFLIVLMAIAYGAYTKSGGMLGNLFGAIRGGG